MHKFFGALFLLLLMTGPAMAETPSVTLGWIEYVSFADISGKLKAKLDTGATISSMRSEVLKIVDAAPGGSKSVVFQITDEDGKTTTLQRQLLRWVKIKSKAGTLFRRPVVEMDFCVAGHAITAEVNLAPRTDFLYPILIGRNMLKAGHILVDPSHTFTSHATCSAAIDTKHD